MPLNLPPLNALRAFEVAARLGSFSAAAAELHVTHGAISRQVQGLESWLDIRLFERVGRRVHLSEGGRIYQASLERAFAEIASATTRVQSVGPTQQLLVNALPTFTMHWLLPRLTRFQQDHTRTELRLVTSEAALHTFSGGFDVAVRRGPAPWPNCRSAPFLEERELPVCSPALLKRRRLKRPEDLAQHTLLDADTRPRAWANWLTEAGVARMKPAGRQTFNHFYLALQAAIDGLGVALGPMPVLENELESGRLVTPLRGPLMATLSYYWVVPRDRAQNPTVLEFCAFLEREGSSAG